MHAAVLRCGTRAAQSAGNLRQPLGGTNVSRSRCLGGEAGPRTCVSPAPEKPTARTVGLVVGPSLSDFSGLRSHHVAPPALRTAAMLSVCSRSPPTGRQGANSRALAACAAGSVGGGTGRARFIAYRDRGRSQVMLHLRGSRATPAHATSGTTCGARAPRSDGCVPS